jgi:hypothetical protein
MSFFLRGIETTYETLLRLFPTEFRKEFGDEMRDVFSEIIEDALRRGFLTFLWLCLLELVDLPVNACLQHLAQHKKEKYMNQYHGQLRPIRGAQFGALGFGIGFFIWAIVALNFKPASSWWDSPLTLAGVKTLVEAGLMFVACALGGLMLSLNHAGQRNTLRMMLAMAVGGTLGRLILFPLEYGIYSLHVESQFTETLLIGGLFFMFSGAFAGGNLGRVIYGRSDVGRFALIGGLAFGIGFAFFFLLDGFVSSSGWPFNFLLTYIANLTLGGIIIGGIFGWFWGKRKEKETVPLVRDNLLK